MPGIFLRRPRNPPKPLKRLIFVDLFLRCNLRKKVVKSYHCERGTKRKFSKKSK